MTLGLISIGRGNKADKKIKPKQRKQDDNQMKMTPIHKTQNLHQRLQQAATQAHGAYKTIHDRKVIMGRFNQYLKDSNIQIQQIDQIKTKHITSYIDSRLAQGMGKRTLQNEMAAIRQTLKAAGRNKLAALPQLSNQALQLNGASRQGTRTAITNSQYQAVYQQALNHCPALAAVLELSRTFGLRGEEAVQTSQSLKTWQAAINNGENKIKVVFGTKGGRPRETVIIDRARAINAVNNALAICKQQGGKLINKPNLKQAMTWWRNHTSTIGLTGTLSPHSRRYAFAQEAIKHYQSQGHSHKESLALTAMDLGHGDGRGRYVERVYGVIQE